MKTLSRLALSAVAAAALAVCAGDARADVCFGGPRPPPVPPDAGYLMQDGGTAWNFTKQLGTGFLAAAALSTGWLCFRRKGKDDQE